MILRRHFLKETIMTTIECEIAKCRHNVNLDCTAVKIYISQPYQDTDDAVCETFEEETKDGR